MILKYITVLLWVIFSTAYLWVFSFARISEFTLQGYFHFAFLVLGGGLAYDITIRLNNTPSFSGKWRALTKSMFMVFFGHMAVLAGIYADATSQWPYHVGVGAVIFGYIISMYYATKGEEEFRNAQRMFV